MTDIRIDIGFLRNAKVRRLRQLLGSDGIISLLNLWTYTAEHEPKGILNGMDGYDICLAADWNGDTQEFINALTDERTKFLDWDENRQTFSVHNWEKRNPYVFYAEKRVERAKKAAQMRWEKIDKNTGSIENDAISMPEASKNDAKIENLDAPSPSPSPSPTPTPKTGNTSCKSEQPDFLDESSSEEKEAAPKTDPLETELFGEDGNSGLWYVWPSARRESKKAVYAAFKAARKRADYPTILSSAKAYCSSPYVSSRIEMKEFSTIKTLPAWLNSDLWERDPASFQEPCQAWKAKYGLNGSANKPAERSPEDKTRSRIEYYAKLAQEKFAEGNNREQVISMLRRCALGEEEIPTILELAQKSTV